MNAEITREGLLRIKPETGIEVFALTQWATKWLREPAGSDKTDDSRELVMISRAGIVIDFGGQISIGDFQGGAK